MKKLAILAALTLMSLSATCLAQKATVNLNNFDSNMAITLNGAPVGIDQNIFVQVLGGTSATSMSPLAATDGTTKVFPINQVPGFFDGGVGVVPGVAAGGNGFFQVQAWQGAPGNPGTFAASKITGSSAVFPNKVGSWNDAAVPQPPPTGEQLVIPGVIALGGGIPGVPEPSTIALGLLGAGALLIRRRK